MAKDKTINPYRIRNMTESGIDSSKPIKFNFDGKDYYGFKGDTVASALLANGVRLIGRSFKYHRRRGFLSAGVEEPNALIQVGTGAMTEPNCQATMVEIYEGMVITSQNAVPSLEFDLMAVNSFVSSLLPSGFYYKTFMWPASWWMMYEHFIRKIAGLGKAPLERDPENYDRLHIHCDIFIAGGGASGLIAAYKAALSGADVIIADEDNEWGGSLLYSSAKLNGKAAKTWVQEIVKKLSKMPNVKMLQRTTVTGYYEYNFLTAVERISDHLPPQDRRKKLRRRFYKIRADKVILAQGAMERPLVFGNNDRPGVMLASSLSEYLLRYQTLCGRKCVIFTNNDSAYATAFELNQKDVKVSIVESRPDIPQGLRDDVAKSGIDLYLSSAVLEVKGSKYVEAVSIATLSDEGDSIVSRPKKIACDVVGMSGGWTPSVHLYSQAGGKLSYDEDFGIFAPNPKAYPLNCDCHCIGGSHGIFGIEAKLQNAISETDKALKDMKLASKEVKLPEVKNDLSDMSSIRLLWQVPPVSKAKAFIDFQNDVTANDVGLAYREGYHSVEHLKRYTTTGMGTDQGKTSNMNALALMAEHRGIAIDKVGTTTFRPPYTGLSFGAIAGRNRGELFIQKRTTPMQPAHLKANAVFEDVGDWKRPRYFPKEGENMHQAVQRESKAVRQSVGLLDATTLGKIDIQGKDSVKLLNMLYTNAWDKLGIGKCRYGIMLNEDGMIFDDGVTTRLGQDHFHMTTTTGGAARVLNWIEEWLQTEWPDMKVHATSVTEQWAVATLSGPQARKLLQPVCDIDLSPEAFPFMSVKTGNIGGIPARIFRISFTGDLAYEINVPAGYGLALWELLQAAGKTHDLCLYGTETMHVLRAEKGFIIVGQDTDGTMTPADANLQWMVSKKKDDFLGKRSLSRTDTSRAGRKQLVGVLSEDPNFVIPEGAHIVEKLEDKPPMNMLGHVTSSYYSPNVGRSVAMAVVKNGFARAGKKYYVSLMDGSAHAVKIVKSANFFDAKGGRQDG